MADAGNGDADLPEGWASVPLGALVQPSKDRIEPAECVNTPYLSLEHIESGTGRIIGKGVGADVASTKAVFHAGDVLYGKLRPYLNKVYVAEFDGICSTDILVFPKNDVIENRLLRHFLSTPAVVEFANHHSAGVQLPRVSFSSLATLAVPLPPMSEQRRVVAKVETLLARVQAVRERLARVPLILKRFRKAVLAAACDGRLTADWRQTSTASETGAELLVRIRTERRLRWKQSRREYETPCPVDDDGGQLPDCWTACRAEEICEFITKGTTPPSDRMSGKGDVPFIKVYNLAFDGQLHFEINPTFISTSTHNAGPLARSAIRPGDVLMNLVGPPLGKVAVVPDQHREWNCNQAIAIYRPLGGVNSRFFASVLLMMSTLDKVIMHAKTTAGQHNLTLEMARDVRLPLPPLAEQHEIVRRVDALFKLADAIERRVTVATARAGMLTQSILGKAFRGELVPTEAELAGTEGRDYESAEQLLARLRSVHSVESAPPSRRRKAAAPPDSGAQRQRLKRGQDVLDVLLLLDAWKKPVSIHVLDPALLLLRNDAARKTLLRGIATPRQRRTLKESPQFIVGLDLLCATLAGRGVIERVGDSAWKLLKPDLIQAATAAERKKAAAVVQAIEALNDVRSLPAIVAELTHERYEVTV